MALSLLVFTLGRAHLGQAAERVAPDAEEASAVSADDARSRILTLLVIYVLSVVFWLAFYQNGFTLTFWARDNTVTRIAPETFQSVEPLGVIVFSAALVWFWGWLGRRHLEPSTPMKMLVGILLVAVAFLVMAAAGAVGGDTGRVSVNWLVSTYLIIALGEVCLSPMGLSLVNRVAPPRSRGVMMGAWFVSLSAGGYMSGTLGAAWTTMPHSRFFAVVAAVLVGAALLLGVAMPGITRVLRRVDATGPR